MLLTLLCFHFSGVEMLNQLPRICYLGHSVVMAGLGLFPPPAESSSTCNNAHTVWSAVVQPPTFVHGSGAMAACRIKVCGE